MLSDLDDFLLQFLFYGNYSISAEWCPPFN